MTSDQIRRQFLEFFTQRHGHAFVPSSSVVPHDDPTLLFANAGMNQFKPIFLGQEKRSYVRAANTQKCIRAGGKHNDLDDVGRSRRHHTLFEMLGNWSFGDYFKAGAIEMAWELLTVVWKLDPERIHVSVYEGDAKAGIPRDDEAVGLWKAIAGLTDDHIHYFGKDNFWEMGETGPCGPCTEIYYDRTPDKTGGKDVNGDDPRVMEIWNLVFIQYNRLPGGALEPLPAKHVDTGMGFERICQVLQGKSDNYAIDLWEPLFAAISKLSGLSYGGKFPSSDTGASGEEDPDLLRDIAFRVIADHVRMATFAITDGAVPSNKKRGAVLRSVIRRAVRFGYQVMGLKEPFLHALQPVVVEQMSETFPELKRNARQVQEIIKGEEVDFLKTIDRGLKVFDEALQKAKASGKPFSGADAFSLHATLGFPVDMTHQLAREKGVDVDVAEYHKLWEAHVKISGQGRRQAVQVAVDLTGFGNTDDLPKYDNAPTTGKLLGWVADDKAITAGRLEEDQSAALVLDKTNFYAEQGGQVGDTGTIRTATGQFDVHFTDRRGNVVLHMGTVIEGHLEAGQPATLQVDPRRIDIMRNHTSTHLLNWALRRVLGGEIDQKGSLVDADKLRFDFSYPKAIGAADLAQVERLVNEKIRENLPVSCTTMPLGEARHLPGVRAVFGEKYPDPVRVVAVGTHDPRTSASTDNSIEFCGGTHLSQTGQAGLFKIVAEEAVSKGVRRVTAMTGRGAIAHMQATDATVKELQQALSAPVDQLSTRIVALQEEIRTLKKKLASGGGGAQGPKEFADQLVGAPEGLVVAEYKGASQENMLTAMDSLKKRLGSYAILLASSEDQKVSFVAAVSDDLIAKGLKAGDWVREAAKVTGGGGGGRPQMAQAGGKDPAKLDEALKAAEAFAGKALGK